MPLDRDLIRLALACKCPRCREGVLYKTVWSLELRAQCPVCHLDFSKNDSADGPAVFLIFILGALLVPMAWIFESVFAPSIWVHVVIWTFVALAMVLGAMRPLKAYIIALQFKYRPEDLE
jgi:uncharacterized protein (DUF983 family)